MSPRIPRNHDESAPWLSARSAPVPAGSPDTSPMTPSILAGRHLGAPPAHNGPPPSRTVLAPRDLSTGGIVGAVLGSLFGAGFIAIFLLVACFFRNRRRRIAAEKAAEAAAAEGPGGPEVAFDPSDGAHPLIGPQSPRKVTTRRLDSADFDRSGADPELGLTKRSTGTWDRSTVVGLPSRDPTVMLDQAGKKLSFPASPAGENGSPTSTTGTEPEGGAAAILAPGEGGITSEPEEMGATTALNASYYNARTSEEDASIERALREVHKDDRAPSQTGLPAILQRIINKGSRHGSMDSSMTDVSAGNKDKKTRTFQASPTHAHKMSGASTSSSLAPRERDAGSQSNSRINSFASPPLSPATGPAQGPSGPPLTAEERAARRAEASPEPIVIPANLASQPGRSDSFSPHFFGSPQQDQPPSSTISSAKSERKNSWLNRLRRHDSSHLEGGIMPPAPSVAVKPPLPSPLPEPDITIDPMQIMGPSGHVERSHFIERELEQQRVRLSASASPNLQAAALYAPSPPVSSPEPIPYEDDELDGGETRAQEDVSVSAGEGDADVHVGDVNGDVDLINDDDDEEGDAEDEDEEDDEEWGGGAEPPAGATGVHSSKSEAVKVEAPPPHAADTHHDTARKVTQTLTPEPQPEDITMTSAQGLSHPAYFTPQQLAPPQSQRPTHLDTLQPTHIKLPPSLTPPSPFSPAHPQGQAPGIPVGVAGASAGRIYVPPPPTTMADAPIKGPIEFPLPDDDLSFLQDGQTTASQFPAGVMDVDHKFPLSEASAQPLHPGLQPSVSPQRYPPHDPRLVGALPPHSMPNMWAGQPAAAMVHGQPLVSFTGQTVTMGPPLHQAIMGPGAGAGGMYGTGGLAGGGFGGGMGSDGLGGFGSLGTGFTPINGGVGGAGGAGGAPGGGGGLGGETTSQPGEYVCLICGRSFEQFHKLNHHKRYHERPHACPYDGCDKSFGTKTHLQRHINDKHVTKWSYYCTEPTCQYSRRGGGRSFPRKDNWRRHMIKKHSITPPPGEPGPDVVDVEDVPPPPSGPAGAGAGDPGPKVPPGAVVLGVAMPGQSVNPWGLDVDGDFDMEDDDDGDRVLAGV